MLIVAFGDIHGQEKYFAKIKELPEANWVIVTGDLTNMGGRKEASIVIQELKRYNPYILAQIGNMDRIEIDAYFDELGINLHGHGRQIDQNLAVFGVGGSPPTPFGTPTEYEEEELAAFLETAYEEIEAVPHKILVSHSPPYNTKTDIVGRGEHVGSKVIRKFIEEHQPELCICGHIHESRNIDRIGQTLILNPGSIDRGYVLVNWDGQVLQARLASYG